jgi:hypothetical protein
MTFVAFLKATVLGCAASASLLGALAMAGASSAGDDKVIPIAAGWWVIASLTGIVLGRHNDASPAISKLLADAPMSSSLPEGKPGRVLFNRLWALLVATVGAGACVFIAPQIPAMAAGFPVIWALAWRRQERAVRAIEERDGVRFFIERTSPVKPIKLVRTPWFRAGGHQRREPGDPSAPGTDLG